MEFIQALDSATLDDEYSRLDPDTLERLRNPPTSPANVSDPDFRLGLDLFLASLNASQDTYNKSREGILRRHPDDHIPSYDQMKRAIAKMTGIVPIVDDMCSNSCIAYTGPLSKLDACTECGAPRLNPLMKKADQNLFTIPLGPQLQAQWRNEESARRMCYRWEKTQEIIAELRKNNGNISEFTDVLHSTAYLKKAGSQSRGRARASLNVNVAMRYVERENGDLIDGDRASEIRKFARAIWVSFGKKRLAPAKWGQAGVETRKDYFQEMNSRFPELRYCDLDWKSEQVATDNYPSWYTTWASKRKELKQESEEDITNKSAQSKRPRKPSTQSALKRQKVENQTEGDDQLGEATMESDVSANIPATTGNQHVNLLFESRFVLIFDR
jgi:hypothetical protein